MTFDSYISYCLAKPGVEISYPFKGECAWLKVAGKMFSLVNAIEMKKDGEIIPPFHFANLKCDPEKAEALRESYAAIQPGWHQNSRREEARRRKRLLLPGPSWQQVHRHRIGYINQSQ